MYTAKLTRKRETQTDVEYTILFSNGTESFEKVWSIDINENHGMIAKQRATQLVNRLNNKLDLQVSDQDLAAVTTTHGERWANRRLLFNDLHDLVEKGIIPDTDSDYVKLKGWLSQNYDRRYLIRE